jgi:ABC-2 type transport system permease protein
VIAKEWRVLSRDSNSIFTVTLLPLLVVGQAIAVIWLLEHFAGDAIASSTLFQNALDKLLPRLPEAASLGLVDQIRIYLLSQLNFYLLLIPIVVSMSFSTFSVVDEKLSGSMEALLATPVRTSELLLGKALAGWIPAVLVTWVCSGVTLAAVTLLGWGELVSLVVTPAWIVCLLLLTPAVALLAFLLGIIGSSRARDARSAQNLAVLIVLPVLGLIALQITGVVMFGLTGTTALAGALILIDYLALRAAERLFRREAIILSWR